MSDTMKNHITIYFDLTSSAKYVTIKQIERHLGQLVRSELPHCLPGQVSEARVEVITQYE